MAYSFEQVFAADPANPSNIATNAAITIFAPGDGTMTPLAITDPSGAALSNPINVNANGFGSAFQHAALDRVAWAGGGFTGFFTSYEGMKNEALAARDAAELAEAAAAAAGANAAAEAAVALADAVSDAEAAATSAATAASLVGAPADTAIATAINGAATATKAALNSTYGLAVGTGAVYNSTTLEYPARPAGSAVQWYGPIPPAAATPGDTWTFQPPATPRPVIFDTDFWTDTDDCVATRLLCHAERLGLIDIRAAIIDTQWARSPGALSALFDFEGRPDVPIGTHSYTPPGGPTYQTDVYDKWPHRFGLYSASQTSVSVYRRALTEAADGTVDIISVGYLTALKDLLASPADSISALTGAQLVAAKVRHLWVMGGYWPAGTENNFNRDTTAAGAANTVVSTWPSPITFLGFEVSASIATGGNLNGTSATDPLALAMLGANHNLGRASWDPMLTWLAALGDPTVAGYTTVKGTATVHATTGVNSWVDSPTGNHRYVVKAQTDRWFRDDLNARLVPGKDPLPAVPVGMLNGVNITAQQRNTVPRTRVALPVRTTSQTAGLLANYFGDDFASLADGSAISHWDDRMLTRPARQTDSTLRPVTALAVDKRVARFAGASRLASDTVVMPSSGTVYARVKFDVVPTGSQTVVGADDINSALRMFSLKVGASGQVIGVGFKGTGGSTATAGNVGAGTWHTIAMRYSPTTIQAALDGTWGTAVSRTGQNSGSQGIALGNKYVDAQGEAMTGDIRQVRVYDTYHNDTTATAVLGVMNS